MQQVIYYTEDPRCLLINSGLESLLEDFGCTMSGDLDSGLTRLRNSAVHMLAEIDQCNQLGHQDDVKEDGKTGLQRESVCDSEGGAEIALDGSTTVGIGGFHQVAY